MYQELLDIVRGADEQEMMGDATEASTQAQSRYEPTMSLVQEVSEPESSTYNSKPWVDPKFVQ